MVKLSEAEIEQLIHRVAFSFAKAKQIQALSQILIDKYGGRVPATIEELDELPGVGRKIANLTVTMAFYKVKDIDEAIALTNKIQAYQGQGHSCGIYSYNDDNIMKLALGTRTSRVMVNQPQAASNSGNLWNGMRQTFSLGCGSWGGNSINHNITWRDLINETWVSKPLKKTKEIPPDEVLFGRVMGKF